MRPFTKLKKRKINIVKILSKRDGLFSKDERSEKASNKSVVIIAA